MKRQIKLLILAAVLISTMFEAYGYQQRQNQLPTEPGYSYEQFASVDLKALPEWQGVRVGTRNFPKLNLTSLRYEGNFTFRDIIVLYSLDKGNYVNGTSRVWGFSLGFWAPYQQCDFTKPRSDINCNEILLTAFTNSQWFSPTVYRYLDTGQSEGWSWFQNATELPVILSSDLTLTLATFQGYSWCPIQGVDNVTRLLCRFNPDYNYQEVVSINASSLASTGTFKSQSVTLNYSLNTTDGKVLLNVKEESGPSCDVTKPKSQNNCQQVVLVGFDIPSYPGQRAPFYVVSVLPYNQTETFSIYPPSSGIQQHLYVIVGTYVGDYKGILLPSYKTDMLS